MRQAVSSRHQIINETCTESKRGCRPSFDAEDLRTGFSNGKERKEPWAVGDALG